MPENVPIVENVPVGDYYKRPRDLGSHKGRSLVELDPI